MKKLSAYIKDFLITIIILLLSYGISLLRQYVFEVHEHIALGVLYPKNFAFCSGVHPSIRICKIRLSFPSSVSKNASTLCFERILVSKPSRGDGN